MCMRDEGVTKIILFSWIIKLENKEMFVVHSAFFFFIYIFEKKHAQRTGIRIC